MFIIILCCVRAHECVLMCVVGVNMCVQRSEDSFVESVLSTFMWLWGIELRSLGLGPCEKRDFTC